MGNQRCTFSDSDIELEAGGKLMPVYTSYTLDKEGKHVDWEYTAMEDYSMTSQMMVRGYIFEFNGDTTGHMDAPDPNRGYHGIRLMI